MSDPTHSDNHFKNKMSLVWATLKSVLPLLIVCISVSDKGSMIFNLVDRILLTLSIFHFDLFHNIINHFFLFPKILRQVSGISTYPNAYAKAKKQIFDVQFPGKWFEIGIIPNDF